jgi:cellulose synthase/poly-beta-1,6-N-acetylglucosamine synthase-like glycosyltransferase
MYLTFNTVFVLVFSYFFLFTAIFFLLSFFSEKKRLAKKPKKLPKVSVLIPAYNEEENIKMVIESLKKCEYPKNKLEIVVVDDGSTDDTYKVAKECGVKVFRKKRGGKAEALNLGIKKCKGDFILVLDADCYVEKNSIQKMLKYFSNEKIAAVVSSIRVYKPANILEKLQSIEYLLSNFIREIISFSSALYITPGASLYRKNVLASLKFDKNNLTEDLEMGLKLKAHGFELIFSPDAVIYTKVPRTIKSFLRQRIRWTYGLLYNFRRYPFLFFQKNELGYFVLPTILIGTVLLSLFFLYLILNWLYNSIYSLYLYSLIGYNFKTILLNWYYSFSFDTLFTPIFYVSAVGFIFTSLTYYLALKEAKENFSFYFLVYLLVYGMLLLVSTFFGVLFYVTKKTPSW